MATEKQLKKLFSGAQKAKFSTEVQPLIDHLVSHSFSNGYKFHAQYQAGYLFEFPNPVPGNPGAMTKRHGTGVNVTYVKEGEATDKGFQVLVDDRNNVHFVNGGSAMPSSFVWNAETNTSFSKIGKKIGEWLGQNTPEILKELKGPEEVSKPSGGIRGWLKKVL